MMTISRGPDPFKLCIVGPFTADLSQTTGTYDLCAASGGDVAIEKVVLLVRVAGAVFTTVAFATDDTTPLTILAATTAASVTAGASLATTWSQAQPQVLRSGKKIQYTMVAAVAGSGSIDLYVWCRALTPGAELL